MGCRCRWREGAEFSPPSLKEELKGRQERALALAATGTYCLLRCCCWAIDAGRSCCCVATHSLSTGNRDSKQGSQQQQQQLAPLGVEWQLQLLLADWIGLVGLIPSPSATPTAADHWRCVQETTTPFLVPSFVTRPWWPICYWRRSSSAQICLFIALRRRRRGRQKNETRITKQEEENKNK